MIPAFVAKSAVRKMCRDMFEGAFIGAVAILFVILVALVLGAPQWLTGGMAGIFGALIGVAVAAIRISDKF